MCIFIFLYTKISETVFRDIFHSDCQAMCMGWSRNGSGFRERRFFCPAGAILCLKNRSHPTEICTEASRNHYKTSFLFLDWPSDTHVVLLTRKLLMKTTDLKIWGIQKNIFATFIFVYIFYTQKINV